MGMWTILLLLFIWRASAVTGVPDLSSYTKFELIFETDTKPESGSIILTCRDSWTANELRVDEVSSWMNRSSTSNNATDLRERKDLVTEVVGCCSIKYTLLPNLEGNYTCGKVDDDENVQESQPLTLICKYCMPLLYAVSVSYMVLSSCVDQNHCAVLRYYFCVLCSTSNHHTTTRCSADYIQRNIKWYSCP